MEPPINILIVDDEPKNLTVLETVLDDPGYRLVRAGTAEQALLALVVEEFALLILDIRMPDMTGYELAQIIKERKKTAQVPIIFLTAYYNQDEHVLEGYGAGAVDYLHKPVNPAVLRSKVAVFAELHRKNRKNEMANRALLVEVTERRRAEEQLRELNETLERRVTERTEALRALNETLEQRVTERTEALREKDVLLKEVHHRVKNNLQVISSILQMQSRAIGDSHYRAIFGECQHRVRTMALVHEKLCRSPSLSAIDLADELRELASMLAASYSRPGVRLAVEADSTFVDIENAVPVGLILNELVSNALKHAFPGDRSGTVQVTLRRLEPDRLLLSVRDDGEGLPDSFVWNGATSLGLTMIHALARQIGATVEVRREGGTEFVLTFSTASPPQ